MANLIKETQKWDDKTGEIVTEYESHTTKKSDEPKWIKLYLDAYCAFKEVKGVNTNVFFELVKAMQWANKNNWVCLTAPYRKVIISNLGWKDSIASKKRLSTEITKLIKVNAIKRIGTSTYQINPDIIGNGTWAEVKKLRAEFNVVDGSVTIK